MAVGTLFDQFRRGQIAGTTTAGGDTFDLLSGTHEILLVTSAYALDHADQFVSDLGAVEVTGTGYARQGITAPTLAYNSGSGLLTVDTSTADITYAQNGSGFTNARQAVWEKDAGADSASPLIEIWDFTADKGIVSGDLVLTFDAAGLFTSPR